MLSPEELPGAAAPSSSLSCLLLVRPADRSGCQCPTWASRSREQELQASKGGRLLGSGSSLGQSVRPGPAGASFGARVALMVARGQCVPPAKGGRTGTPAAVKDGGPDASKDPGAGAPDPGGSSGAVQPAGGGRLRCPSAWPGA